MKIAQRIVDFVCCSKNVPDQVVGPEVVVPDQEVVVPDQVVSPAEVVVVAYALENEAVPKNDLSTFAILPGKHQQPESTVIKVHDLISNDSDIIDSKNRHMIGIPDSVLPSTGVVSSEERCYTLDFVSKTMSYFYSEAFEFANRNFDINKMTPEEIYEWNTKSLQCIDDTGSKYIKLLSMPVKDWKKCCTTFKDDKSASFKLRNLSIKILQNIENLEENDSDYNDNSYYTMPYFGMSAMQSAKKRWKGKYPKELEAFADAGNADIVKLKIGVVSPGNRYHAHTLEAFFSGVVQIATSVSRGKEVQLRITDGTAFNDLLCGSSKILTELGQKLNEFFIDNLLHGDDKLGDRSLDNVHYINDVRDYAINNWDSIKETQSDLTGDDPLITTIQHLKNHIEYVATENGYSLGGGYFNKDYLKEMIKSECEKKLAELERAKNEKRNGWVYGKNDEIVIPPKGHGDVYFERIRREHWSPDTIKIQVDFYTTAGYPYLVKKDKYDETYNTYIAPKRQEEIIARHGKSIGAWTSILPKKKKRRKKGKEQDDTNK